MARVRWPSASSPPLYSWLSSEIDYSSPATKTGKNEGCGAVSAVERHWVARRRVLHYSHTSRRV
jgi:hypothetical protein